jgi:nickel transport protein
MKRLCLILAMLLLATPASAHRLKLFATLESGTISGYAFFVGSGRAHGAAISVKDAAGKEIAAITTDDNGAYSYKTPAPQTYHLTANTGDGHIADATIDAARFGGGSTPDPETNENEVGASSAPAAALTQAQIERAVDAAVARQVKPLIEAYELAEGRTRFNDIMGGIGMIIGLAGLAMWASARRAGAKS